VVSWIEIDRIRKDPAGFKSGSVRGVVGIMSGIISENLMIAYYAE
jgi:hypothetical protein